MTKQNAIQQLGTFLKPFELHDLADLCERFYREHGSAHEMHPATVLHRAHALACAPLGGQDGFGALTWLVSSSQGLPELQVDFLYDHEAARLVVFQHVTPEDVERAFAIGLEGETDTVFEYVSEQLDDEDRADVFRYLATDIAEYSRCLEGAQRISNCRAWPALLHDAVKHGDMSAVSSALALGAKATAVDPLGNTPLHVAAAAGHHAILVPLLAAGAGVDETNLLGRTPLHLAAQAGQVQACLTLLANFADPARKDLQGQTPMDQARLERGYEQSL